MGKILLTVDDRIRFDKPLPRSVEEALVAAHEYSNPEVGKRIAMGFSVYGVPAKLKTWRRDDDGTFTLPRGGMHKVRELLAQHGVPYAVKDARHEGLPVSERSRLVYRGHELRIYQREMVDHALEREQCIVRGGTGCGKTTVAFALAAGIGLNTLVVLPTARLFEQWSQRADFELGLAGDALGIIQGPKRRLRTLTIAMMKTLSNRIDDEIKGFFGAVMIDEVQTAPAEQAYRVIDQMPARYRIGVSASERRRDRKEVLSYDLFSSVAYEAKREMLIEEGHVLDVAVCIVPTKFSADWYGVQNDEVNWNRLLDEMTVDEQRNKQIVDLALGEIGAGEKVVVLTHRREHARAIEKEFVMRGIPSGLLLGEENAGDAEEFERTKLGIQQDRIKVGIGTYGSFGYGIDLPAASVGIAATPVSANEQNFGQVRGRLCRTMAGKKGARIYVMMDTRIYGAKHVKNLCAWNKDVTILDGSKWVNAKQWLARKRSAA